MTRFNIDLFNILDGIVSSDYCDENLSDINAIIGYAESCGKHVTRKQAGTIQSVGLWWKHMMLHGNGEWDWYRDEARARCAGRTLEVARAAAMLGAKGGAVKSKAKTAAARSNGAKGGRPRKEGK